MATATEYGGFTRSPSLPSARSPDTASPIYPDRAIRPLPKSRLKAKLSPEQASIINYPPEPPPMSPTLQFSQQQQQQQQDNGENRRPLENGIRVPATEHLHHYHNHNYHAAQPHDHCTCHEDADSGEEEVEFDHPDYRYHQAAATPTPAASSAALINGNLKPSDNVRRRLLEASRMGKAQPPPLAASTASSADGYESFENTNNKKKRKIPVSSASSVHQSQLSAEMASMGISGQSDGALDDGVNGGSVPVQQPQQHYAPAPATPASGTGISGAGRGRYGRQNGRSGDSRRPLGSATMNATNGYGNRAPPRLGDVKDAAGDVNGIENTGGIISQAIKTAAEQGPLTPPKVNSEDGASLLQSANGTTTPKTQFTFSCESESGPKMEQQQQQQQQAAAAAAYSTPAGPQYGAGCATPGSYPVAAGGVHLPPRAAAANGQPLPGAKGMSTQGTQTTPSLRQGAAAPTTTTQRAPPAPSSSSSTNPAHPPNQQHAAPTPAAPAAPKPTKPRRRPSKEYALAARQRQLQQEYTNYHHRPTKENMWICEFCEYEDIFGVPPLAMIRAYEVRDRQERKKAAEKRRLLEKAKMKGRKGKKGKGGGGKGNGAVPAAAVGNNATAAAPASASAAGGGAAAGAAPPVNGTASGAGVPPGQGYETGLQGPPPALVEGEEYFDDGEEYGEGEGEGDEYEPVGAEEEGGGFYPPTPALVGTPAAGGGVGRGA